MATTSKPKKNAARPASAKRTPKRQPSTASKALNAFSIGALTVAGVAAVFELVRRFALPAGNAEHVPTDLMGDTHPGPEDRAIDAFRPDPTAPIPASERDAFRPAFAGAHAPTLVAGQATDLPGASHAKELEPADIRG